MRRYQATLLIAGWWLATNALGETVFTNFVSFAPVFAKSAGVSTNSGGGSPKAGMVLWNGILYGTTAEGGTNGTGTIFKVNADGSAFATLHRFADGGKPAAVLCRADDALYGTTQDGGTNASGSIFKIGADGSGFTNVYSFTPLLHTDSLGNYTNADGAYPAAALVQYGTALYGTATDGGTNGNGTVFRINTDGTGFAVLHNFGATPAASPTNSDGAQPTAGLSLYGGKLYGTAEFGGLGGDGGVFTINPDGSGFTNLYSFSPTINFTNSDGAYVFSGLVVSNGTIFGTTLGGGVYGNGTLFSLNTNGGSFTNFHAFSATLNLTNADGAKPAAALLLVGDILFGTAQLGGAGGYGTVFSVSTNGLNFTKLYSFKAVTLNPAGAYTNADGALPQAELLFSDNSLYGTSINGGSGGTGGAFVLSLGPIPLDLPSVADANILTWGNPAFSLQVTTNLAGPFVTVPGAASPYTNAPSAPAQFFRLQAL